MARKHHKGAPLQLFPSSHTTGVILNEAKGLLLAGCAPPGDLKPKTRTVNHQLCATALLRGTCRSPVVEGLCGGEGLQPWVAPVEIAAVLPARLCVTSHSPQSAPKNIPLPVVRSKCATPGLGGSWLWVEPRFRRVPERIPSPMRSCLVARVFGRGNGGTLRRAQGSEPWRARPSLPRMLPETAGGGRSS